MRSRSFRPYVEVSRLLPSLLILFVVGLAAPREAHAEPNYLSIAPYGTFHETPCSDPAAAMGPCGYTHEDARGFFLFSRGISSLMLPPLGIGAKSLGESGSRFTFYTTYAGLLSADWKKERTAWEKSFVEGDPTRHFFVGNLTFRKGLPYSIDLGFRASYAFNSNVFGMGFEFKYAFLEGYTYAPDLAFLLSLNTIVGVRDFLQGSAVATFVASKSFGISGTYAIVPRLAYQLIYSGAASFSMNTLPADPRRPNVGNNTFDPSFSFGYHDVGVDVKNSNPSQNAGPTYKERGLPLDQRLVAGLDFNIWIVVFSLETAYQLPHQTLQVTLGLGLDY